VAILLSLFIGALFAALGCYMAYADLRLTRVGRTATAEVVDLKWADTDGSDQGSYYPVVVFRTADGQQVRAPTKFGSFPPPAQVGERVQVIYDPADPAQVRLERLRGQQTVFSLVFIVVGGALLAYAIFRSN
jgi:hypothetical protein